MIVNKKPTWGEKLSLYEALQGNSPNVLSKERGGQSGLQIVITAKSCQSESVAIQVRENHRKWLMPLAN